MTHATAQTLPDPQPKRCIINGAENLWTGTAWHPRRALEARVHHLHDMAERADRVGAKQSAALYRSDADHIRNLLNEANSMTPRTMHDPLTAFLHRIDRLAVEDLHDAFVNEVNELGGCWIVPEGTTTHLVEITIHGITGRGTSEAEAIADWREAAETTLAKER